MRSKRIWHRRMRAENLERRDLLAGAEFAEHPPIAESDVVLPEAVYAADMDRDGDIDILSASRGDDKIAWYENLDGAGAFGSQRIITSAADAAMSVYAADLDGDGHLDVLSVSRDDRRIAWYRSIDRAKNFGPPRIISSDVDGVRSVHVADLDADGDLDVLYPSAGQNRHVVWFENTDGNGAFGPARVIETNSRNAWAVSSTDLDGDHDLDVLVSFGWGDDGDRVIWVENTNGRGDFGSPQVIGFFGGGQSLFAHDADGDGDIDIITGRGWAENIDGKGDFQSHDLFNTYYTRSASVTDLDGDGHLDVISYPLHRNRIIWSRNTDGSGTFETDTLIPTGKNVSSIFTADVNGDGHQDVITANVIRDEIVWHKNTGSSAVFGPQNVITVSHVRPLNMRAVDLDADGDLDVLAASSSASEVKTAWYENTDGTGTFGRQQLISTDVGHGSRIGADTDFCTFDADADRDIDIVLSSTFRDDGAVHSHLSFYENTDGLGTFARRQIIDTGVGGALDCVDLDTDGDIDVLTAFNYWDDTYYYGKIVWYENTNDANRFGPPMDIASHTDSRVSASAVDLDGDGDIDVLATSNERNTGYVSWYENIGGTGTFGRPKSIANSLDGALSVHTADLDSDGDLDILTESNVQVGRRHGSISWNENMDGAGSFGPSQLITRSDDSSLSALAVDLDGEGDVDVLVLSYGTRDDNVTWHENVDGGGTFADARILADGAAYSLQVVDMDSDRDQDLVFVTRSLLSYRLVWHENTDGAGTFGPRLTIGGGLTTIVADLDNDQDVDILTATEEEQIVWYEGIPSRVLTVRAGDANRDGQFDQWDVVQMLQAGKFSTGQPATWSEGDYDGDGVFDQLDIIAALQTGRYLPADSRS